MATTNSSITITKPLMTCPACEKEIEAETVISFDGDQTLLGGTHKTINLNGQVVGIKMQHDCTPKPSRGRGRPPGTKNKPKPEPLHAHTDPNTGEALRGEPISKSNGEAHRDRLREHEATVTE